MRLLPQYTWQSSLRSIDEHISIGLQNPGISASCSVILVEYLVEYLSCTAHVQNLAYACVKSDEVRVRQWQVLIRGGVISEGDSLIDELGEQPGSAVHFLKCVLVFLLKY